MKLKTSIIRVETTINFIFWVCSVSYAIYETYQVGNRFFSYNFEDKYNDFSYDWKWLQRKKDNSDPEWKYGTQLLKQIVPWYMVHFIIAEILRQYTKKDYLKIWYIFIGISFCMNHLGWKITIYFLFQPLVGYILVQCRSKSLIWLCNLGSLVVINYYDFFQLDFSHLSDYKQHISISAIAWINLRSLNYFLDATLDNKLQKINIQNVCTVCAYCFYLPIMFYGPLISFTDYNTIFEQTNMPALRERFKTFLSNLIRFIFWLFFAELALHCVYVNALSYQSQVISQMNLWALYGQGYCMGQFFHIKYVVFYGISTTIAQFEGIIVPKTPKCIGRIHLYSDMWKYFDRGLYLFLLRYIYIPICSIKKTLLTKILASFISFLYVYVWHGTQVFIAIWSLLNFVGITVEILCKEISKTALYQTTVMNNMSKAMHRRLTCALATPLFAMSALSNFYFFAGKEVGDIYIHRFLQGQFSSQCMILIILYFGSQVSVEVKNWENSRKQKQTNIK